MNNQTFTPSHIKTRHVYVISLMFIAAYLGKPSIDRYLQYEYCMSEIGTDRACMVMSNVMTYFGKN